MKDKIKKLLQGLLGFRNYLFLFSIYIILTLRWNRKERDFLYFLSLLPGSGTVLDIGANIGIMSVHLARKLPEIKVIAFEPIPDNFKTLRSIISFFRLQNKVTPVQMALGDRNGEAEMILPVEKKVKLQGLSHVKDESIETFNKGITFHVQIRRLDDVCIELDIHDPVAAIKIDVENFEYFVLKGAKETILKNRPLIYAELWDNENRNKCMEFLSGLDYHVYILQNKKLVSYQPELHTTQNFFFVSNGTGNTLN